MLTVTSARRVLNFSWNAKLLLVTNALSKTQIINDHTENCLNNALLSENEALKVLKTGHYNDFALGTSSKLGQVLLRFTSAVQGH